MRARIYRPARTAMQSGTANVRHWILVFEQQSPREIDPLMGWTSSADTRAQVRLRFETEQAALAYAREHGIEAVVEHPKTRKPVVRPRGYGENFVPQRRQTWTH